MDVAPLCRALIDEVLTSFKPQARSKGLALEFESSPEEVTVSSDRRAVQQILMNLVHNAIKFTNNGTVLVRLASGGGARPAPPSASAIPASASARSSAMRCSRPFRSWTRVRCGSSRARAWACT
jgi:signal transduction histidine kinase